MHGNFPGNLNCPSNLKDFFFMSSNFKKYCYLRLYHRIALTSYYLQFNFRMPQRCSGEMILYVIILIFFARETIETADFLLRS